MNAALARKSKSATAQTMNTSLGRTSKNIGFRNGADDRASCVVPTPNHATPRSRLSRIFPLAKPYAPRGAPRGAPQENPARFHRRILPSLPHNPLATSLHQNPIHREEPLLTQVANRAKIALQREKPGSPRKDPTRRENAADPGGRILSCRPGVIFGEGRGRKPWKTNARKSTGTPHTP